MDTYGYLIFLFYINWKKKDVSAGKRYSRLVTPLKKIQKQTKQKIVKKPTLLCGNLDNSGCLELNI